MKRCSQLDTTEISRQLGIARSTVYKILHQKGEISRQI